MGDGEGWTSECDGPQTTLQLQSTHTKQQLMEVFISDNVAVRQYSPQLHARRIKSVRMIVRWRDQSQRQFLGAVSLAEAAALRGRLHHSVRRRSGGGTAGDDQFEVLFPSGRSIDCSHAFPRHSTDFDAPSFEQARALLRFFNSDTWFNRHENIALVKGLAHTSVADRALFYQGVSRCRRDAGVRWQTMPVGTA